MPLARRGPCNVRGEFANCGLATILLKATVPGPGNTITLKLGAAKIG